jgi:hypothetical protein
MFYYLASARLANAPYLYIYEMTPNEKRYLP